MTPSIPKISELAPIFFNEDACISFLFNQGILIPRSSCQICCGVLKQYGLRFRCTRDSCRKSVSIFEGSFFAGQRLKCCEILHLGYLWLTGCSYQTIIHHTAHSDHTISSYMKYFRGLVSEMIDTDDTIVGGPGVVVEVDETKVGKRKYNRGHSVEGAWVIVGVELTEERLIFAEVVQNRNASTLEDVLSRHIAADSIIQTDCWRGYSSISERFGIEHRTVNHSNWFTDPETGYNTNTVEGNNYAIKRAIPIRCRTQDKIGEFLHEFIWRRKNKSHLWSSFIYALKEVLY